MLAKVPSLDLNSDSSELYVMQFCPGCKESLHKLVNAGFKFDIYDLNVIGTKRVFKIWEHRLGYNPNLVPQFWFMGQYVGNSLGIDKFLKEKNVT